MIKNSSAILIVLIAGLFWSFGPLVVRYIDDAQLIPWQYLFFRGSVIFLVLNIYLFLAEGLKFTKNYKQNRFIWINWRSKSWYRKHLFYTFNNNNNGSCYNDDACYSAICSCNFSIYFFKRKNLKNNIHSNNSCGSRDNIYVARQQRRRYAIWSNQRIAFVIGFCWIYCFS